MMDLTREYYEAVRDCTPEDCGDCILRPATNRACYTVDVDPGKEARMILGLMDERDALRARVAELEAENARIIQEWAISEAAARGGAPLEGVAGQHNSEAGITLPVNYTIDNLGSVSDMHAEVDRIVRSLA